MGVRGIDLPEAGCGGSGSIYLRICLGPDLECYAIHES